MRTLLNTSEQKIVDRYAELFLHGKKFYSDREFIMFAVELMNARIHSEEGMRQAQDNEKPIKFEITGGIELYEEIRKRLEGSQIRRLEEVLRTIRRELPDNQYFHLKQPIEALNNRKPRDKERILNKKGIKYNSIGGLISLM